MQEVKFQTRKTARYFTLGNPDSDKILYVLHGYGQLAKYFLAKFDDLKNNYFIVAPEGLHRFYRKGFYGAVGASWMTKEDRLSDIEDYTNYLNELHASLSQNQNYQELIILGFSQGVATAFRWIESANFDVEQCIICSGMIPPDINLDLNKQDFTNIKWTYITGDNDEFRDDNEVKSFVKSFETNQLELNQFVFSGGHTIDIASVKMALDD